MLFMGNLTTIQRYLIVGPLNILNIHRPKIKRDIKDILMSRMFCEYYLLTSYWKPVKWKKNDGDDGEWCYQTAFYLFLQ